jgi:hypothetical protein
VSECDREVSKNEKALDPKGLSSHRGGGGELLFSEFNFGSYVTHIST